MPRSSGAPANATPSSRRNTTACCPGCPRHGPTRSTCGPAGKRTWLPWPPSDARASCTGPPCGLADPARRRAVLRQPGPDTRVDRGRGLQIQRVGLEGDPRVLCRDGKRVTRVRVAAECTAQRREAVTDQPRLLGIIGHACHGADDAGLNACLPATAPGYGRPRGRRTDPGPSSHRRAGCRIAGR